MCAKAPGGGGGGGAAAAVCVCVCVCECEDKRKYFPVEGHTRTSDFITYILLK